MAVCVVAAKRPDNSERYYGKFKIVGGATWSSDLDNENSNAYQALAAGLTTQVRRTSVLCLQDTNDAKQARAESTGIVWFGWEGRIRSGGVLAHLQSKCKCEWNVATQRLI